MKIKTIKMHVFAYIDTCGGGLLFTDELKNVEFYDKNKDSFKPLGVFDLPLDFVKSLGYKHNHRTLNYLYIE